VLGDPQSAEHLDDGTSHGPFTLPPAPQGAPGVGIASMLRVASPTRKDEWAIEVTMTDGTTMFVELPPMPRGPRFHGVVTAPPDPQTDDVLLGDTAVAEAIASDGSHTRTLTRRVRDRGLAGRRSDHRSDVAVSVTDGEVADEDN
jgi:hypothetical protein